MPGFLDTNILVYAHDGAEPEKRAVARALVSKALETNNAVISYQVVQEFLNVARKRFQSAHTHYDLEVFLDKVLMPLCAVMPSAALYHSALSVSQETGFGFYDSLVVASALQANCSVLWTEDLQHGRTVRGMEIRNPFD